MGTLQEPPPKNKALLRDYENPLVFLNKALLGAYGIGGVPLGSHDLLWFPSKISWSRSFFHRRMVQIFAYEVLKDGGDASKIIENWKNPYELGCYHVVSITMLIER